MCTRKTLIASAVLLGLGLTGQAFAQATNTENGPGADTLVAVDLDATDSSTHDGDNRNNDGVAYADGYGTAAANNGGTATATFSNAFNHSKAVAETKLIGSVSGVTVYDIGNVAKNWGDANGGSGGRGGAGFLHGLRHGVEDRHEVRELLARLPRRHAGDDLRAIVEALLRVERALLAGQALADHLRILVDQDAHGCAPASFTTFDAASVSPVAATSVRPLLSSISRPFSTFVPSRRTTTGTLTCTP